MTASPLLVVLISLVVMATLFLVASRSWVGRNRWLGLAALALSAPFFHWLGSLSERFDSGFCYSDTMASIASAVEGTQSPPELAAQIRSLPLRGYETVCSEVEVAAGRLPNASAP